MQRLPPTQKRQCSNLMTITSRTSPREELEALQTMLCKYGHQRTPKTLEEEPYIFRCSVPQALRIPIRHHCRIEAATRNEEGALLSFARHCIIQVTIPNRAGLWIPISRWNGRLDHGRWTVQVRSAPQAREREPWLGDLGSRETVMKYSLLKNRPLPLRPWRSLMLSGVGGTLFVLDRVWWSLRVGSVLLRVLVKALVSFGCGPGICILFFP